MALALAGFRARVCAYGQSLLGNPPSSFAGASSVGKQRLVVFPYLGV